MARKRIHDITVHIRRKDRQRVTREQARNAFWAAQEIARHGGSVTAEMREWEILAIDWRKKPGKAYHYAPGGKTSIDEVLQNMVGILREIGKDGLRVEVPGHDAG